MGIVASLAIIAIVSLAVTLALVPVSMELAQKLGAIDQPGERRLQTKAIPRLGGIAIVGGIAAGSLACFIFLQLRIFPPEIGLPPNVSPERLAIGVAVIFVMGLVDDARDLPAGLKFVIQLIAAAIVASGGAVLGDILRYDGSIFFGFGPLAYPLTMIYLVAFSNIINLIDGMDGLAAGVCAIAAAALVSLAVTKGIWAISPIAIALIAACIAFLFFNFHPAKLFMGDCGSQTLGFVLGILSLIGTMRVSTITSLAVPVIIAGIPVLDTFSAIVRRRRRHVSISTPDKGHIHHGLLKLGLSQRAGVLFLYGICAVFAVSGVVVANGDATHRFVVLIVDLVIAFLLIRELRLFGEERTDGLPVDAYPPKPMHYRIIKRAFDLLLSIIIIIIGIIPCLILSIFIAFDTKASPIYSQTRMGHKGSFNFYKFRTMVKDSDDVEKYLSDEQLIEWYRERTVADDPRVTKLGRVLRRYSIDELPQFINVFLGQLSIIGPRCITTDELRENFGDETAHYLSVPSGITGLWACGPRNEATFLSGERQRIELEYVENASLRLDAKIAFLTLGAIIKGTGI